jgi:hypothetical protein
MKSKLDADSFYQREVWAKLEAMLPEKFAARNPQSSSLGAEAAIYGMSLLARMMGPLLRRSPANHAAIEPLVVEAIARDRKGSERVIQDWQRAMEGLAGFVREVPVRVDRTHDGAVILLKILSAAKRSRLHPAEATFLDRAFQAVLHGEMLRPNTRAESVIIHLGDAAEGVLQSLEQARRGGTSTPKARAATSSKKPKKKGGKIKKKVRVR